MLASEFRQLIASATVLARKVQTDKVAAVKNYLNDNGVKCKYTDAMWLILGSDISLFNNDELSYRVSCVDKNTAFDD